MTYRFGCILLDQDTENPPFQPARFFFVNVFAETKDQVIDALVEEYPWCDIMFIDKMMFWKTDDELMEAYAEWHDMNNLQPVREAPLGREY